MTKNNPIPDRLQNVVKKISFLMEHQVILPDLKELVMQLRDEDSMYWCGVTDALMTLISSLEEKSKKD